MSSGAEHPWPAYSAAFVEVAGPHGRLLLRPRSSAHPGTDPADSWRALTAALDVQPATVVWVVTASDPYPRELDAAANALRARQLEDELDHRSLQHLPALARSPDGSAQEVSRAVIGTTREEMQEIASRFEQLAVFEIAAELACVETATGRVVTSQPYVVGPACV